MTIQSEFHKGFHGKTPEWLKTNDNDEPAVKRNKKKTNSKKK